MIRVIINADDLGKTPEVDLAIKKAFDDKVITSSTVLANTEHWEDVHSIINTHPEASFGVHLNLTEGRSMTKDGILRQYGITNDEGIFTGNIRKIKEIPQELAKSLYNELSTQIDRIKTVEKIPITHIDGHHHVHTLSSISEIVLKVAKDNGITRMRNRYIFPVRFPRYGIRSMINDIPWRFKFKKNGIIITRYFGPYQSFVEQLRNGIIPSSDTTIELMCHPGHDFYKEESDLLFKHEIERYLIEIKYINYSNL